MAYLRERTKEVDIDFPLESVWQAIPKAVDELGWSMQENDENSHTVMVKTEKTLTSYESMIKVELKQLNANSTRMTVYGQTPVTTITSTLQFGQTYDSIEDFVLALAEVMNR